jgi:hypothetical protein
MNGTLAQAAALAAHARASRVDRRLGGDDAYWARRFAYSHHDLPERRKRMLADLKRLGIEPEYVNPNGPGDG